MKHKSSKIPNKRLYRIYGNMKQRCYNPNNPSYSYYGGKGITICQEWLDNFMNFYNWSIQNGYEDDLTIDRKESSKGYCPENCRWVTLDENSRRGLSEKVENNITRLRELTNLSQPKFCKKYGIPLSSLRNWEQGLRKCPDYVAELLEFVVKQDLQMFGEFTLRNFLNALFCDVECEIVTDKYTDMAKKILQDEYIGLDDLVEKWDLKDGKLFVWI